VVLMTHKPADELIDAKKNGLIGKPKRFATNPSNVVEVGIDEFLVNTQQYIGGANLYRREIRVMHDGVMVMVLKGTRPFRPDDVIA
jgi:hypothetical protein